MAKQPTPLEALKTMNGYATGMTEYVDCDVEDCFKIIENALKDYVSLLYIFKTLNQFNNSNYSVEDMVKKAKALEIIKNFIHLEFEYNNIHTPHYSISASGKTHIEQEVFDLLKEVLK